MNSVSCFVDLSLSGRVQTWLPGSARRPPCDLHTHILADAHICVSGIVSVSSFIAPEPNGSPHLVRQLKTYHRIVSLQLLKTQEISGFIICLCCGFLKLPASLKQISDFVQGNFSSMCFIILIKQISDVVHGKFYLGLAYHFDQTNFRCCSWKILDRSCFYLFNQTNLRCCSW